MDKSKRRVSLSPSQTQDGFMLNEGKDDLHDHDYDHHGEYHDDFLMFWQRNHLQETQQVLADNHATPSSSRSFKLVRDESFLLKQTSTSKFTSSSSYADVVSTTKHSYSPCTVPSCSENYDPGRSTITTSTTITRTPVDQIVRSNNLSSCPRILPRSIRVVNQKTSFDQFEEDEEELRSRTMIVDEGEDGEINSSGAAGRRRMTRDENQEDGIFDCIELDNLPSLMIPELFPPEVVARGSFAFVDSPKNNCSSYADHDETHCFIVDNTRREKKGTSKSKTTTVTTSTNEQGSEVDYPLYLKKEESHSSKFTSTTKEARNDHDESNHGGSSIIDGGSLLREDEDDVLSPSDHTCTTLASMMNSAPTAIVGSKKRRPSLVKLRPKRRERGRPRTSSFPSLLM